MISSRPTPVVTFLRSVPIFGGLEGASLDRLFDLLQEQTWAEGDVIFEEGELGRTMYVLREGEVCVMRKNSAGKTVPIVALGPGETFGEMTLVELQPRSASVVVTGKAKTYSLTNMDLYNLYREDNFAYVIVLQNICRMLSRRLRKADSRIVDFITLLKDHGAAKPSKAPPAKKKAKVAPKAKPKRARGR